MSIEGGGAQKTFEQLTVDEKKQNLESVSISNELKEIILISLDETSTQEDFIAGAFTDNTEYKSLSAETKRALHEALGIPFTEPKREAIDTKEIPAVIAEITTKIPAAKITLEGNTVLLTELQETMEAKALQIGGARPKLTKEYKDFLALVAEQITPVRDMANKIATAEAQIESLRTTSDKLFKDGEAQSNIQTEDTEAIDREHKEKISTLEGELNTHKENGDVAGMLATLEIIAAKESNLITVYQEIIDANKQKKAATATSTNPPTSSTTSPPTTPQPAFSAPPTGGAPTNLPPAPEPPAQPPSPEGEGRGPGNTPPPPPENPDNINQLREHLALCRERLVRAEHNRDRMSSLMGRFKSFLSRPQETNNPDQEYQVARAEYERAHAQLISRQIEHRIDRERERANLVLDEQFARSEMRGRAKNAGVEKGVVRKIYDWMGEANLEKVIKPTTRLGKMLCKTASVRTLAGLALTGTGIGAAYYGFMGASALALGAKGVMSGMGSYDLLKNVSKNQKMTRDILYNPGPTGETIPDQVILNFTNEELISRISHFHYSMQSGENNTAFVQDNPMYKQLRGEYLRRISEARHQTIFNALETNVEVLDTHLRTIERSETRDERIRIACAGLIGASTAALGWIRADLLAMDAASAASAKTAAEAITSTPQSVAGPRITVSGGILQVPPNAPPQFNPWTSEIADLKSEALVGKGEGVTHALVRQLDAMEPEELSKFGFTGNAENHNDLVKFAAKLAREQGYIDDASNRQVWVMPTNGDQHYYAIDDSGRIHHIIEDAQGKPLTGAFDVSGRGFPSEGEGWHSIETADERWGISKPGTTEAVPTTTPEISSAADMKLGLEGFGAENVTLNNNLSGSFVSDFQGKPVTYGVNNGYINSVNGKYLSHLHNLEDLFKDAQKVELLNRETKDALSQSTEAPRQWDEITLDASDSAQPAPSSEATLNIESPGAPVEFAYTPTAQELGFTPLRPLSVSGNIVLSDEKILNSIIDGNLTAQGEVSDMAKALGYTDTYLQESIDNVTKAPTQDPAMYRTMLNKEITRLFKLHAANESLQASSSMKAAVNDAINRKINHLQNTWGLTMKY